MITIELMQDFSEIVQYEHKELPLFIRTANLSIYPDMSAPCHWHEDIEWIHVLEGKMGYYINGKRLVLEEKDSLMINTRQMHYGYSWEKQDCRFICILFHPSLFCSNPALLEKYITPVLKNQNLAYLHTPFRQTNEQQTAREEVTEGKIMEEFLTRIAQRKQEANDGYALEVIALIHMLWMKLWQKHALIPCADSQETADDLQIQKDMVAFLYQHYPEKISLEQIAAAGNVSRSKCCRIFQHYLQQSPIDFLNEYRLKVSGSLLTSTDKRITEIAFACGFNHLSYYSKCFFRHYGCTPREYRKHEKD